MRETLLGVLSSTPDSASGVISFPDSLAGKGAAPPQEPRPRASTLQALRLKNLGCCLLLLPLPLLHYSGYNVKICGPYLLVTFTKTLQLYKRIALLGSFLNFFPLIFKKWLSAVMQFTVCRVVQRLSEKVKKICVQYFQQTFHKVSCNALFIKLMKRNLPIAPLDKENWLKLFLKCEMVSRC